MLDRGLKVLNVRAFALGTAAVASAMLFTGAGSAQTGQDVADPPVLQPVEAPVVGDPPVLRSTEAPTVGGPAPRREPTSRAPREILLDLNIEYVDGVIYNPSTGVDDKVRLRSYTRPGKLPPTRYLSPAIVAIPGDTVRVKLNNKLPPTTTSYDAGCGDGAAHEPNVPHCFNGTNLHTHGLWVNPAGNGDNVLLSINPGVSFEYEYAIPNEHPAGTFWYHTHRHGSTALQVSSGMAGPLLIRGDRLPTPARNGDLDTLLDNVTNLRDRTLVFQQIQYGCFDKDQNIKIKTEGSGSNAKVVAWVCDPGDVGGIETYEDKRPAPLGPNGFGPRSWGASNRYTSINGLILPTFRSRQGAVERWRLIHGGVRDTIRLSFRKARSNVNLTPGPRLAAARMGALIEQSCQGPDLPFHLVAADGLTLSQAQRGTSATLQPGYRFDALVRFPDAGNYCVIDTDSQATSSVGNLPSGSRLLAMMNVAPDASQIARGDLAAQLIASAQGRMPANVREAVVADLRNDLRLSRFVPHKTIAPGELKGGQELTFNIQIQPELLFRVANQLPTSSGYDPQPYAPARLDRKLTLGTAEEWKLTSNLSGHPFHIHVNPFEVVRIVKDSNPNVDVSAPGANDGGDPQYPGLRGVFKDTLWIKQGYTATVRTRYQRYIGEFVLHCHILDHEDQGMMQNVAIVLPGGTPASVNAPAGGHSSH
ncbi:MAG TPA: multicopper oxidase family protein [Allosphingosinicella sp.]|nr:multicopper oxidase family protein [Allosphingosinicella sp.]